MPIVPRAATVEDVTRGLDEDGYALVENLLGPAEVALTRAQLTRLLDATPLGRNDFEDHLTRRIHPPFMGYVDGRHPLRALRDSPS